jgi:hypothetical protein
VLADCAHAPEKPVRGYDFRLASNLAGQEPERTRLAVSAGKCAVNAGKKKGAVSEYCAPMKNPYIPIPKTAGVAFWFKTRSNRHFPGASYLLSSQRAAPKTAEQTEPTKSASRRNFRFFLMTFGSGSSGLGRAGIMAGSRVVDSLQDSLLQGCCFV